MPFSTAADEAQLTSRLAPPQAPAHLMPPTAWMYVRAVSGFRPLASSRENTAEGRGSLALQVKHQKMDWLCSKVCPKVPCSHHLPSPHCPYRSPLPTHPGTPLHPHPPVSHRSSSEAGCNAAAREARHWMARLRTPARLSSSSGSSACEGPGKLVPMHHWHSHAAPAPDCSNTCHAGLPRAGACRSAPSHPNDSTQPPTFLRPSGSGSSEP